jgi:hypothetical protein
MNFTIKRRLGDVWPNVIVLGNETPSGKYANVATELCIDINGQEATVVDNNRIIHTMFITNEEERLYKYFFDIVGKLLRDYRVNPVFINGKAQMPVITFYVKDRIIRGVTISCGDSSASLFTHQESK